MVSAQYDVFWKLDNNNNKKEKKKRKKRRESIEHVKTKLHKAVRFGDHCVLCRVLSVFVKLQS